MRIYLARFLIVWLLTIVPAQWRLAYAQSVRGPGVLSESEQRFDADLLNKRSAKLATRPSRDEDPVRTPNITPDYSAVRTPNAATDSLDSVRAQRAASRLSNLTTGEVVSNASRGTAMGQTALPTMDLQEYQISDDRADPGVGTSAKQRKLNTQDIMPGYSPEAIEELKQTGKTAYDEPEKLKGMSEGYRKNTMRDGCRTTNFVAVSRQNIQNAHGSANHRILKVEFFDVEKIAIPNTSPVEYQKVTRASTYKRGKIKLDFPTLGAGSNQWFDYVDDTFAIRYTYTPFTQPRKNDFFTFNHRMAIASPGLTVLPESSVSSYGTPKNGFTPTISATVPTGVAAVYFSADLYRTNVYFSDPPSTGICPPDPPQSCEVSANDGSVIRWCPGSPGAGVMSMYDDISNPSADIKAFRFNENTMSAGMLNDAFTSGVLRGLSADESPSATQLTGSCQRHLTTTGMRNLRIQFGRSDYAYCSHRLVNPYPNACSSIKRLFGLSKMVDHTFLTYRGFNKVAVPIIDPVTNLQVKDSKGVPQFTYRKDPAGVQFSVDLSTYPVFGEVKCATGACTTEIPDNPNGSSAGYFMEWSHTPAGIDPKGHAVANISSTNGLASATHFGNPANNWAMTGTASGNGTVFEVKVIAEIHMVTINDLAGCEAYLDYVADGYCRPGRLTCLDSPATKTVGTVTFGPGLPTSGILDILKKWGTDGRAQRNSLDEGEGIPDTVTNEPLILLNDQMCWEARAEAFETCLGTPTPNYVNFTNDKGEIWASDCSVALNNDGQPIQTSSCERKEASDACDNRMRGAFTGVCYQPSIAYDCGEQITSDHEVEVKEWTDSCTGAMRCLGTECHRPNLAGDNDESYTQAAATFEAWNMGKNEMYCKETGGPPTAVTDACTPILFGGKKSYCKIPLGNSIGITPNCCKDAVEGAKSAPSMFDYHNGAIALSKLKYWKEMGDAFKSSDIYNSTSKTFGEVSQPVVDAYKVASQYITENFVQPLSAGFDSLFSQFAKPVADAATQIASKIGVDSTLKSGAINAVMEQVTQQVLAAIHTAMVNMFGENFAAQFITANITAEGTKYAASEGLKQAANIFGTVMLVYSVAKLIGHIVFKCKQEEYEWGMNMKWGLCTAVTPNGSCCNRKNHFGICLEQRNLYCCYKSMATRVIAEQIIKQNLSGTRTFKYRTSNSGRRLEECAINCGGFTPAELGLIDWSKVDLSEWTDTMIKSGQLNPKNQARNYNISTNTLPVTNIMARKAENNGDLDNTIPATKTADGQGKKMGRISDNSKSMKESKHCYGNDDRKMPYTYPECNQTDCGNIKGIKITQANSFLWVEDAPTGEWLLTHKSKNNAISEGMHEFSAQVDIRSLSRIDKFVLEWTAYDDWIIISMNDQPLFNGPHGGDILERCSPSKVRIHSGGLCDKPLELYGIPHGEGRGGANLAIDVKPYLKQGLNDLKVKLAVGNRGEFSIRFRTKQKCSI